MRARIAVADAEQFAPPRSRTVMRPFEKRHWPALQMLLADPDGREVAVQAPLPPAKKSPAKKHSLPRISDAWGFGRALDNPPPAELHRFRRLAASFAAA
ncbi:MAG TPA: hypothetical protein VHX11_11415 [Acidobacteriaceae bacterium]|jgi:hypothetical protein|nr:hypothetical protein [Acidobacteriaceae bacterium]